MQAARIRQLLLIITFCLIKLIHAHRRLIIVSNHNDGKKNFDELDRSLLVDDYDGNHDDSHDASDQDDNSRGRKHGSESSKGFDLPENCGQIKETLGSASSTKRRNKLQHHENYSPEIWQFFGTIMSEQESSVCGSTIVSSNIVVTSRTCGYNITVDNQINSLRIILGDWRRNQTVEQRKKFKGKVVWPTIDCAPDTYTIRPLINGAYRSFDDFLMIKFDEELDFVDSRYQPACLGGRSSGQMKDFDRCLAIGHNNETGSLRVESEEVEYENCWLEDESQFCFKSKHNPSWSTCTNDSGGPILCYKDNRWHLIGIVSTVQEKCDKDLANKYGIYNVAVKFENIYGSDIWKNCLKTVQD